MTRWQWTLRQQPSRFWSLASPVLALLLTVGLATLLFVLLGRDPVQGLQVFSGNPSKAATPGANCCSRPRPCC